MSFDIYSDIDYLGYQHINQMIFNGLNNIEIDAKYYYRFYMNMPSYSVLRRKFLYRNLSDGKFKKVENVVCKNDDSNIIKISNFPSLNLPMDIINSFYVNQQISGRLSERTAITFIPSKALKYHFEQYGRIVYYCVHDSHQQTYHNRHKEYEKELLKKANFVFCDNEIVTSRLAFDANYSGKIIDISDRDDNLILKDVELGCRFFIVPPPVPDEFYAKRINKIGKYDFVYFGSIHENIDDDFIFSLADSGRSVLMITNQRLKDERENIIYIKATSDMKHLVNLIALGESIILPYRNTSFMETVSPAKIYQSLATGKQVLTTNKKLSLKYNINMIDIEKGGKVRTFEVNEPHGFDIEKYKESILINKILKIISTE